MVWLVGAGPGDPDLLTVKALQVLQGAEVVVHDGLVSAEILEMAPTAARRISVAKRKSRHSYSQDEINRMLVAFALEGLTVVRLKGGDPFIFGRGGEELEACRAAGVECHVVPGVTAALAAAAARAAVTPGTTWHSMPASRAASSSSPPRPKMKGSPPFRRTTVRPSPAKATSMRLISSWL